MQYEDCFLTSPEDIGRAPLLLISLTLLVFSTIYTNEATDYTPTAW